ncbi:branched-chain amino acid ABC transporter permease [Thermodesulfobacteriota bacterium]
MLKKPCGVFDENYVQDSSMVRTGYRWTMLGLLLLVVFVILPWRADEYILDVMIDIAITIIAVLGLQIITGFTGQISIGQAAFMAVGAWISAMLSYHHDITFWISMPVAALCCGLLGILVGIPSLKIRGFYIAVTTLVVHSIIMWVILHGGQITMGVDGLTASEVSFFGFAFDTELKFYYLALSFTVAIVFLTNNMMRTRVGRSLLAVRDNDLAAEFMGINMFRTKLVAFFLSAVYGGIAGALLAHYQGIITVDQFTIMEAIWMLGMIIVGGATITGAIFGVFFLKVLVQAVIWLTPWLGGLFPAFEGSVVAGGMQIFFGAVILLFLIFEPRGLAHRWQMTLSTFRLWPFPY